MNEIYLERRNILLQRKRIWSTAAIVMHEEGSAFVLVKAVCGIVLLRAKGVTLEQNTEFGNLVPE